MIGWVDGHAGASGDMLLGALVDIGVDIAVMQTSIDRLDLGITLRRDDVVRGGLGATKVHVDVPSSETVRHLADIVRLLDRLERAVRERSIAVFERLARAEAHVHRTTVDEVHFHEVGALDSIADVVGACAGFVELDLDSLHCSTLGLGSGSSRGAHGPLPVPAPAVLAVLDGIGHVAAGPAPYEATTPTGAALLAEWVDAWGPMPAIASPSTGMGAGTIDTDAVANVCRLVVGTSLDAGAAPGEILQLDANVDDLDPRIWPSAIEALMEAGALDAWVTPIVMKKGRPAHTFSALCAAAHLDEVSAALFANTSTIGVRRHSVEREVLDRSIDHVVVDGRRIAVKRSSRNGVIVTESVEWDDVVAAATASGRPPRAVLADATARLATRRAE